MERGVFFWTIIAERLARRESGEDDGMVLVWERSCAELVVVRWVLVLNTVVKAKKWLRAVGW